MKYVYFAERDGLIKIGCSRDPFVRVKAQSAVLITAIEGDFKVERAHHERFAADRLFSEWFKPSETLKAYIAGIPPFEPRQPERNVWIVGEVADYLGVSAATVRSWAKARLVPSFQTPGGRYRFYRQTIESLAHPEPAGAAVSKSEDVA